MILDNTQDLPALRAALRHWFVENVPPNWRRHVTGTTDAEYSAFHLAWFKKMEQAGLATAHWGSAWGGADLSLEAQVVLGEEVARADAPELYMHFNSLYHVPATLSAYGSEEQRARYIPGVRRGEVWCQGFSEPGAGSDLASLRTRAEKSGDEYIINGQKIWSSGAMHADFCLLLARTDPEAPKHRGISYFLMDMRSPGIEIRPTRQISGHAEFAELFLDDVRIPAANLVGPENAGWKVAQATLSAERGLGIFDFCERLRYRLDEWFRDAVASNAAWLADAGARRRLMNLIARTQGVVGLLRRLFAEHLAGHGETSMMPAYVKVAYPELLREVMDFQMEMQGLAALADTPGPLCNVYPTGAAYHDYIRTWMLSIAGGTNEIMRNLIAERGLGLPR